jgi:hypothetical protein
MPRIFPIYPFVFKLLLGRRLTRICDSQHEVRQRLIVRHRNLLTMYSDGRSILSVFVRPILVWNFKQKTHCLRGKAVMCNCTDKLQCRKHEITAIRISLHNENKFHIENTCACNWRLYDIFWRISLNSYLIKLIWI